MRSVAHAADVRPRSAVSDRVLTRWPVGVRLEVAPEEIGPDGRVSDATLSGWLNSGRAEYWNRLPPGLRPGLTVTASHVAQREPLSVPAAVTVAVSVVELRQQTFDMQLRVREEGTGAVVASGGCTVTMVDPATGERVDLPSDLREALIQLEQTAAHYC